MLAFTEESSLNSQSRIDHRFRMGSLLIIYMSILTMRLLLFSDFFWFFILRKEIVEETEERGVISIVSTRYQVIRCLEECPGNIYVFPLFIITGFYIKWISPRSLPSQRKIFLAWGVLMIFLFKGVFLMHVSSINYQFLNKFWPLDLIMNS